MITTQPAQTAGEITPSPDHVIEHVAACSPPSSKRCYSDAKAEGWALTQVREVSTFIAM